jgi:hypothetical protein
MLSDGILYAFRSSLHVDTYRKGRCHRLLGPGRDGSADAMRDGEGIERETIAKAANWLSVTGQSHQAKARL